MGIVKLLRRADGTFGAGADGYVTPGRALRLALLVNAPGYDRFADRR
jgi:hypothetical protein